MKNNWFHFSDEQWAELKRVLDKYEKAHGQGWSSNVNRFIVEVENCCKAMPYLKSKQDLADHRDNLKRIERDLKVTAKDLKTMCHKNFNLIPQVHINDTTGPGIKKYWHKNAECSDTAYIAYGPVIKLLEMVQHAKSSLDNRKPSQGRPRTDPQGLITEIARIFARHIDKPTTYDNGPFVEVLRIVLDALNLPAKDPSRAIKKAIQEISPH